MAFLCPLAGIVKSRYIMLEDKEDSQECMDEDAPFTGGSFFVMKF